MADTSTVENDSEINKITEFLDVTAINKIINNLTDYAEILSETKLFSLINYDYKLSKSQIDMVIKLLLNIQAISVIHDLSMKVSKNLETGYISNIISNSVNPENISTYLSLKKNVEARLNHQIQQYNINMNKSNTFQTMPINELRGHVRNFNDLKSNNIEISTTAQHGYIAASLHDTYITLINQPEWWNDYTYIKFFFNEDDLEKKETFLISKKTILTLTRINDSIEELLIKFSDLAAKSELRDKKKSGDQNFRNDNEAGSEQTQNYDDRMQLTPFGRQYGHMIDETIHNIFDSKKLENYKDISEVQQSILLLYGNYQYSPDTIFSEELKEDIVFTCDFLLFKDYQIKTFVRKFLYIDKKIPFGRFYTSDSKKNIEQFITLLYTVYFKIQFSKLFRIVKSLDMKKFACAFIIKKIYLAQKEEMTTYGYFLIRAIGKIGQLKVQ